MKTLVQIGLLLLFIVLGLVGFFLLKPSSPDDPIAREVEVRETVMESLSAYRAALERGDYEAVAGYYADDPRFFWVEDGAVRYTSREQVGIALEQVQSFGTATYDFGEPRIEVLDADHAIVSMEVKTTFGDPAAGGFSFKVAQTMVMVRSQEGWQFLNGHSSSPKPRG